MKAIALLVVFLPALVLADQATEEANNAVTVRFYRLQTTKWVSEQMEATFAAIIASGANTYCSAHPNECGLNTYVSVFKEVDIGKVTDYPKNDEKDMRHQFFVRLPAGSDKLNSSTLEYVLSKAVVIGIVGDVRSKIYDELEYHITWADDTFFGLPVKRTENIVISIVAALVLVAVIILAIGLHKWHKKREYQEKLQKKIEKKKMEKKEKQKEKPKDDQTEPTYKIEKESKVPEVDKETIQHEMYGDSANLIAEKPAILEDSNGMETRKGRSLPPLTTAEPQADESDVKKKKKKKKEKRHRRSKKLEIHQNQSYESEDSKVTEL